MKSATMIYRLGTETVIWGINIDTKIVDESEVDSFIAQGWYRHPNDVKYESVEHPTSDVEIDKPRRGRPPKVKE